MMELAKYKVCPTCGEHNAPSLLECRKCETDLTGIKVVDSETEKKQDETTPSAVSSNVLAEPVLMKVCDCGAQNPPQARKCQSCGEDISDVIATNVTLETEKAFTYRLKEVEGDYAVTVEKMVFVIGREAEMSDYLANKPFVSRQQAKLTIVAGKVLIENLSKTNKTYINNAAIPDNEPATLESGDEIGLGGMEINGKRQDKAAFFQFEVVS